MIKSPEFDDRRWFGSCGKGPLQPPDKIVITEGMEVDLCYRKKTISVKVTNVLAKQSRFEGVVQYFEDMELENEDLKFADKVLFPYEKIERIFY